MSEFDYKQPIPEVMERLSKAGVFLNSAFEGNINTMTIGWGSIGVIWGRPIFIVMVRYSRNSYELINKSGVFTVSIPRDNELKKELSFCGRRSGRDYDKFKECNLTPLQGRRVDAPVIDECKIHYECRVVYRQAMEPGLIDEEIDSKYYSNNDFHVIFYGEILDCYTKRE